jgi:MFS transporter, DHA1 family, multidrug resistance protein
MGKSCAVSTLTSSLCSVNDKYPDTVTATISKPVGERGSKEFRAFTGLSMAASALSIDLILPAFDRIRRDLKLGEASSGTAGLITAIFIGLAVGQIPAGMASDRWGRKPVVRWSCALFILGTIGAFFSPTLPLLLVSRFVWGLGAAGLRTCAMAMIRDRFSGAEMGREMAFAMTIFLIVPVIAPVVGSLLIKVMTWRALFVVCALFGMVIFWWQTRLPETLHIDDRQPMRLSQLLVATKAIGQNRTSLGYTLAMLPIFGVFASYLGSSERLVGKVFGKASLFPLMFGFTAFAMGAASLYIGRNVERLGMHRMIRTSIIVYTVACFVAMIIATAAHGKPNFWLYFGIFTIVLMAHNGTFPQLNSGAMQPVGHVAGAAAAVMGTTSNLVGAAIGAIIDNAYDGTVNPFTRAFFVSGLIATALILWARSGSKNAVAP